MKVQSPSQSEKLHQSKMKFVENGSVLYPIDSCGTTTTVGYTFCKHFHFHSNVDLTSNTNVILGMYELRLNLGHKYRN